MTAFENFFKSLKKILEINELFEIWPNFEPDYDKREYASTNLRGLGDTLLLNCGKCDGPSDMRNSKCKFCVEERTKIAQIKYEQTLGRSIEKWPTIILCRIHTE